MGLSETQELTARGIAVVLKKNNKINTSDNLRIHAFLLNSHLRILEYIRNVRIELPLRFTVRFAYKKPLKIYKLPVETTLRIRSMQSTILKTA